MVWRFIYYYYYYYPVMEGKDTQYFCLEFRFVSSQASIIN